MLNFFLIAAIQCYVYDSNQWMCYDTDPEPSTLPFYCTNCVALSEAQCNEQKSLLKRGIDESFDLLDSFSERLFQAHNLIWEYFHLTKEGNIDLLHLSSYYSQWNLTFSDIATQNGTRRLYAAIPNEYKTANDEWDISGMRYSITRFLMSFNIMQQWAKSIPGYDINNQAVQFQVGAIFDSFLSMAPTFETQLYDIEYKLVDLRDSDVPAVRNSLVSLNTVCNGINCTPTLGIFEGQTPSEGGCICGEFIEDIADRIKSIQGHTAAMLTRLESIDTKISDLQKKLLESLGKVSDTLERLDSYVEKDLHTIVTNLQATISSIQDDLYYCSSTNYTETSDNLYSVLSRLDEGLLRANTTNDVRAVYDFATNFYDDVYVNMPWYQRIEALLFRIAFSDSPPDIVATNSHATVEGVIDSKQTITQAFTFDSSKLESLRTSYNAVLSAIELNLFSTDDHLPDSVLLLAKENFIGETDLRLSINRDLCSVFNTVFGVLWLALYFVGLWYLIRLSYYLVVKFLLVLHTIFKQVL